MLNNLEIILFAWFVMSIILFFTIALRKPKLIFRDAIIGYMSSGIGIIDSNYILVNAIDDFGDNLEFIMKTSDAINYKVGDFIKVTVPQK